MDPDMFVLYTSDLSSLFGFYSGFSNVSRVCVHRQTVPGIGLWPWVTAFFWR